MNIKKNDTVIVLSGKDKGVKGKVLVAMPTENKVIVEGVNVATCHTKPRRQGETGGIVKKETPIRACKVALYCPKCDQGVRVGFKVEDGKKSVAFSLVYRDRDKTLTDEEVTEVHSGVLDALKDKLNAVLREI